jgi:hypothetical protein
MSKRLFSTLAIAGALLATSAIQAQQPLPSRDAATKAVKLYAAQVKTSLRAEESITKAVPRLDKAEAVFIGRIELVDSVDFLDDGTPFRIVAIDSRRPSAQFHFVFCLGTSAVNTCGRLREGRRVQFTADVLTIEEGDEAGLALFVAKKVKT